MGVLVLEAQRERLPFALFHSAKAERLIDLPKITLIVSKGIKTRIHPLCNYYMQIKNC
jgi:hypothetical protein